MQLFSEALKILFDKRLIPTIFGLVFGALIYAITPDSYWLLERLGKTGYFFVCAGLLLLFATLAQRVSIKIKDFIIDKELDAEHRKEEVEKLWSFIDNQK